MSFLSYTEHLLDQAPHNTIFAFLFIVPLLLAVIFPQKHHTNSRTCISHGRIKPGSLFYWADQIIILTGKRSPAEEKCPPWWCLGRPQRLLGRGLVTLARERTVTQPPACSVPFSWKCSAGVLASEERDHFLTFKKSYCSSEGCPYCRSPTGPFDLKLRFNSEWI